MPVLNRGDERQEIPISPGWLLLCALVYLVCVTASDSWSDVGVLALLLGVASVPLKVESKVYSRALKSAWLLIVFAAAFHLVFRIWFVGEQDQSVAHAILGSAFFVCRLLLLIIMSSLLLWLFTPAEYAESVASRIGVVLGRSAAGYASHVVMLSFSMLPQLQARFSQRSLARKLRGLPPPSGIADRLEFAKTELSAAIHAALDYASIMAIVLWSRGFDPKRVVHLTKRYEVNPLSLIAAIAFCILCLITLLPQRIS